MGCDCERPHLWGKDNAGGAACMHKEIDFGLAHAHIHTHNQSTLTLSSFLVLALSLSLLNHIKFNEYGSIKKEKKKTYEWKPNSKVVGAWCIDGLFWAN